MNKEQVTAVMDDLKVKQDLYRLHKLEKEYNDLSDKCNKLYKFIYSLDFADKVRNADEQILLQEQHKRMEAYRTNLYQRIQFYRSLIAINNGYDILTPWCEVAEKIDQEAVESAAHNCDQDTRRRDEAAAKLCDLLVKGCMAVYAPSEKCAKCGGDLFEGLGVKEGEKILCFNCASQITNDELQQALDEYRAACSHHCGQDVQDADDACCQARAGRVDHDAAPAAAQTGDSLKSLKGMQVIKVCGPKCKDCPCGDGLREYPSGRDMSTCVKVELVGGYYLCLAPLPIVTE
jgi:hypothetical protein